jgi:hypothetical protein
MGYGNYLREQSSDCLQLVVKEPWSEDAGDLIELAIEYTSAANELDAAALDATEPRLCQGWSRQRS